MAARATNQPSDKGQAESMIEETVSNTGEVPKEVSADAGCYPAQAVDGLYALGTDPPVAPEQTRHGGGHLRPGAGYPPTCRTGTG